MDYEGTCFFWQVNLKHEATFEAIITKTSDSTQPSLLKVFSRVEGSCMFSDVVLGSMTKNSYHGIFQNYTSFTVYDGIYFFMHIQGLTTFSTDWERKNGSRLTYNGTF